MYYNLSYSTLSGARDFKFEGVSDLTARLSILLKHATLGNRRLREIENEQAKRLINEKTIFEPKIEDPLNDVIKILDLPDIEQKIDVSFEEATVLKVLIKLTKNKKLLILTLLI